MLNRLKYWLFHRLIPGKYPLMLFGGWICIHSHKWADIGLPKGWLVVCWRKRNRYAFYSPDGTPTRAVWGVGKYNRS